MLLHASQIDGQLSDRLAFLAEGWVIHEGYAVMVLDLSFMSAKQYERSEDSPMTSGPDLFHKDSTLEMLHFRDMCEGNGGS